MKRIDICEANSSPNFIGSWMLDTHAVCDALINHFESHSGKHRKGVTTAGKHLGDKRNTDLTVLPNEVGLQGNEILKTYIDQLYECYKDYLLQWPFLGQTVGNLEIGPFSLVRYHAGDHFQKIHTERADLSTLHRILVWMTYLNDVEAGGSTYFSHYDIEVQPRQGLTLIWPAEWTHAHRGNVLGAGSKYIITGWMHFPQ